MSKRQTDSKPERREALSVAAVLAVFLLVETLLYRQHWFPLTHAETDGLDYLTFAAGPLLRAHAFHGPGYPLAIRLLHLLSGVGVFEAAKLVSLVSGLGFLIVGWRLMRACTTGKQSALAVALLALSPVTLCAAGSILSDMLGAFLGLAALALLSVPRRRSRAQFVAAGLCAAGAYLTRYVYLVTLALPLLVLLADREPQPARAKVERCVSFLLAFLLATAPWLAFLLQEKGNPLWSENHLNAAFKLFLGGRDWTTFPSVREYGGWYDVVMADPSLFVRGWLQTMLELPGVLLGAIPWLGVPAGVVGCFVWHRSLNRRAVVWLAFSGIYALVLSLVWLEGRFLLVLLPVAAALVAAGLQAGLALLPPGWHRSVVPWLTAACLLVVAAASAPTVRDYFQDQALEYKAAAEWLAALNTPDASVMAAKPHLTYLSGMHRLGFVGRKAKSASLDDLPQILAKARPAYLVYDARFAGKKFPQFSVLLDPRRNPFPDLLQPVFETDAPLKVVIYRVTP